MSRRRRTSHVLLLAALALVGFVLGGAHATARAGGATAPAVAALRHGGNDLANGGDLSRYQYIILQASEWARVPALKAANPGVKLLAYEDMSLSTAWNCTNGVDDAFPASALGYCATLAAHPDWFLTDTNGNRVMSAWYANDWFMDIGNTAYQNAWAAAVVSALRLKGFDGVMLDDANPDPSGHLGGRTLAKYPTTASYRDAASGFLRNVCGQIRGAGFLALPNIDGGASRSLRNEWAGYCDGSVKEYWVKWGSTAGDVRKTGVDWNEEIAQLEDADAAGKILLPITYAPMSDVRDMVFARASFLLGWNGRSASAEIWNVPGTDPWSPSWTASVGSPNGPRRQVTGGVWRRDFTDGTVLVNPDASATVTVPLGGTYLDLDGSSVSSVTLGPATGAILAATQAPAPAPTSTQAATTTTTASTTTAATTTTRPPATTTTRPAATTTTAPTTATATTTTTAPPPAAVATPVRATFGNATSGGGLTVGQPTGTKYANRVVLTAPATLTKVRAFLAGTGGSFAESLRAVVFADAAGSPGKLLASSQATAFGGTLKPGWVDLKLPAPVALKSGAYWLGLQFGGATRVLRVGFDDGAAGVGRYNADVWGDGPSATFGPSSTDHESWAVYGVVTAGTSVRALDAAKQKPKSKRPRVKRR
jgi:hypothetical protein